MPVPGQVGRIRLPPRGDGAGQAPVQAAPLARHQLGVEHLADQPVREGVAVVRRHQQPGGDGLPCRRQQAVLGEGHGRGQQLVRHPAVGHADLVDDRPGRRRDAGGPGQHGLGDGDRGPGPASAREFQGVQRVTPRRADHVGHLVGPAVGPYQVSDELGDLGIGQAGQPEPRHPRAALKFGEPLPGIAVEILLAQRRDDQNRLLAQPDREEGEQLPGRFIGPVQVLQDEHEWRLGRKIGQQREHPLEEAVPRRDHVAVGIVGEQPPGPVPQRRHERPVGQRRPSHRRRLSDPYLGGRGSGRHVEA